MSGKVQSGNTRQRKKRFEEVAEDERWMKLVWKVGKITKPLRASVGGQRRDSNSLALAFDLAPE